MKAKDALIVDWGSTRDAYEWYHPQGSGVGLEQVKWLEQTLGYDAPRGKWHRYHAHFYFKNEKDLMMFLLRWSA